MGLNHPKRFSPACWFKNGGVDNDFRAQEIHHPNPPDERSQIQQTLAPLPSNHNQLRRSGASSVIYQAAKTEGENFRCLLGKRYCLSEVGLRLGWLSNRGCLTEVGSGWLRLGRVGWNCYKVWVGCFFFVGWDWHPVGGLTFRWLGLVDSKNDRRCVGSQKSTVRKPGTAVIPGKIPPKKMRDSIWLTFLWWKKLLPFFSSRSLPWFQNYVRFFWYPLSKNHKTHWTPHHGSF